MAETLEQKRARCRAYSRQYRARMTPEEKEDGRIAFTEYRNTSAYKASQQKHKDRMRVENPRRAWFKSLRARSKAKGIEFNLIESADALWPAYCPVLGIPIIPSSPRPTDNSPSCDRLDPGLGYVRGNVRVISQRANRLKDNCTDPNEMYSVACDLASRMTMDELSAAARVF
jgi:hypothetical protein